MLRASNSLLSSAARALRSGGARSFTGSTAAAAADVVANTDAERAIAEKIASGLAGAKSVRVEDTSGGCGTMYAIDVCASDFEGKMKIKQHQLVTKLISDDVKEWHGGPAMGVGLRGCNEPAEGCGSGHRAQVEQ